MNKLAAPLAGVRVIDLSHVYSGPYATFLMAMAGAEVVKVEPRGGENLRRREGKNGAAAPFAMLNANKKSVALDLKSERGKDLLRDLLREADVLVENFRPGVLAGLGFGDAALRALNARLIRASISGFGSTGPYRDYPAMDLTVQAVCGVVASTGWSDGPPVKSGAAVADFAAGTHLYGAIVTALFARERDGVATPVEVAMIDALYPTLASNVGMALTAGEDYVPRTGNRHGGMSLAPYNIYAARDGYIAILCTTEAQWSALVDVLAIESLRGPEWLNVAARVREMDFIDAEVGAACKHFARSDLFERLGGCGVPCAPVRELPEVLNDPHMHATGMLVRIDHPEYGPLVVPRSPLKFLDCDTPDYRPSPALGADTAMQFDRWLEPSELAALKKQGVLS